MKRLNWSELVRRIDDNRAPSALFFKPVCVISAIDLADEGLLVANDLNASFIVKRFADYVLPFNDKQGGRGYKPLWHLSNDGIWSFSKDQKTLNLRREPKGSPASMASLLGRFDRLSISEEYAGLWEVPQERRVLRDSMLLMLYEGGADCRNFVKPLFNPRNLLKKDRHPSDEALVDYFKKIRDQLPLFEDVTRGESSPEFYGSNLPVDNVGAPKIGSSPKQVVLNSIDGLPSPVSYYWNNSKIAANISPDSLPIFDNINNEKTFGQCLNACSVESGLLLKEIRNRKWQVNQEFGNYISMYLERLPSDLEPGNIILADNIIRALRDMFKAEAGVLPSSFAARLKVFIQMHYALRTFYPEIKIIYQAMINGRIDVPLPLDAVTEIVEIVKSKTPELFDDNVSKALTEGSAQAPSNGNALNEIKEGEKTDVTESTVLPPIDPLGEPNLNKALEVQNGANVNAFWKVFKAGGVVKSSTEAWIHTFNILAPHVSKIIEWLKKELFT